MADFASEHFAREAAIMASDPWTLDGQCCSDMCLHWKPYTEENGIITSWQFYCSACTQIKLIVSDEVFARMEGVRCS